MNVVHGIYVNYEKSLPVHWNTAIGIWLNMINKICNNFNYDDSPWEYLERTNSAIFATALTLAGAPAMPETYVIRNGQEDQKEQRVDICVILENKTVELIEVKIAEYDPSVTSTSLKVSSRINDALKQVSTISGIHGNDISVYNNVRRYGVVIGLPCVESEKNEREINFCVQKIIYELKQTTFEISAWIFPKQYFQKTSTRYVNKYYFGTFLVVTKLNKLP